MKNYLSRNAAERGWMQMMLIAITRLLVKIMINSDMNEFPIGFNSVYEIFDEWLPFRVRLSGFWLIFKFSHLLKFQINFDISVEVYSLFTSNFNFLY